MNAKLAVSLIACLWIFLPADHYLMAQDEKGIGYDGTIGGEYLHPQGTFADFSDDGGGLFIRVAMWPKTSALSFWFDGSLSYFGRKTTTVTVEFDNVFPPYVGEADQITEFSLYSFYLGIQLGNPSRRAAIRPRAGIGIGFNVFLTKSHFQGIPPREDEDIGNRIDQALGRWGWRSIVGLDIFTSSRIGGSLDLFYDHLWGIDITKGSARYLGIRLGVVFAIEKMNL